MNIGTHSKTSFFVVVFVLGLPAIAVASPPALEGGGIAALGEPVGAQVLPEEQGSEPLRSQVKALGNEINGEFGITIKHIESGRGFHINGGQVFPTASVYKVPILVEVFRQAQEGNFSFQDRVILEPDMLHFSRILAKFDPGLNPTIRDLAFWMITASENGATDILLKKVGAENVTATMRKLGLKHINVNRTVKEMMCDYVGIYDEQSRNLTGDQFQQLFEQRGTWGWYRELWRDRNAPLPESVRKFNQELKDVASPNDMAALLEMIFSGKVVSESASRQMIDIMLETTFAPYLIPALLPPGTPVARKAGTLPTSLNEVGIIELPDEKGHVIVAIMTNNLHETRETAASFIARVARAAYDYFVGLSGQESK